MKDKKTEKKKIQAFRVLKKKDTARTRTPYPLVRSLALYRLSYAGTRYCIQDQVIWARGDWRFRTFSSTADRQRRIFEKFLAGFRLCWSRYLIQKTAREYLSSLPRNPCDERTEGQTEKIMWLIFQSQLYTYAPGRCRGAKIEYKT